MHIRCALVRRDRNLVLTIHPQAVLRRVRFLDLLEPSLFDDDGFRLVSGSSCLPGGAPCSSLVRSPVGCYTLMQVNLLTLKERLNCTGRLSVFARQFRPPQYDPVSDSCHMLIASLFACSCLFGNVTLAVQAPWNGVDTSPVPWSPRRPRQGSVTCYCFQVSTHFRSLTDFERWRGFVITLDHSCAGHLVIPAWKNYHQAWSDWFSVLLHMQ